MVTESALPEVVDFWRNHAYDGWLAKQDVPVHTGYYIEDARTLERGWWSLRGCPAAIISLEGHRGIEHVHVLEIPPGETLPPFRMALEEVIYVFEGQRHRERLGRRPAEDHIRVAEAQPVPHPGQLLV